MRAPSVYRLGPGSGLVRCHTRTTGKGKFTWADGSTYVGFYVADKREGKGEAAYANGDRYKGEMLRGARHGLGTFTFNNGA